MKTKTCKKKGRELQNYARDKILFAFPELQMGLDVAPALMGESGEDIKLSEKARQLFPFSVECKSRASVGVYKFFDQAKKNAGKHTPLLIIKQNKSKPLVVIDAEVFFEKYIGKNK